MTDLEMTRLCAEAMGMNSENTERDALSPKPPFGVSRRSMNQQASLERDLLCLLNSARGALHRGLPVTARILLRSFWIAHAKAPAITRRRWKCGQ